MSPGLQMARPGFG